MLPVEPPAFFRGFAIATAVTAGLIALQMLLFPKLALYGVFAAACLLAFGGLCLLIYRLALPAAQHADPARLAQYVLAFTLAKMLVGALVVAAYLVLASPRHGVWVLPFFTSYVVYTVYETRWLMQLSTWGAARATA